MLQCDLVFLVPSIWLAQWAQFASNLTFDAPPQAKVEGTKQVLFDCISGSETIDRIEADPYVWAAPFTLATTTVNAASIAAFREPAREDDRTRSLARPVVVREGSALTAMLPGLRPARVAIFLKDGSALRAEALSNKRVTEGPYSAEEVRKKFHEVTRSILDESRHNAILETVDGLDRATDIRALDELVAG